MKSDRKVVPVPTFLGLLLGLGVAEGLFWVRDGGAFAHLNVYEADAELGARLQANATTRIAFGGNAATTVRTNERGFRGENAGSILTVGDSQVFGLGVEDEETFSAKLQAFNGGVPTYGPQEYTAVVERLAPVLKPKAVVYVVNLSNDLFELERPNKERHTVWDGWAVRKETAPAQVTEFLGRRWLMSRSHLVYAVRRLLHSQQEERALPSEGSWQDIAKPASAPAPVTRETLNERMEIAKQLHMLNGQLVFAFSRHAYEEPDYQATAKALTHYQGDARDIVANPYAEAARPVDATAAELLRAALGMEKNVPALQKLAAGDKELSELLAKRTQLREKLGTLSVSERADGSPLATLLQRTHAACAAVGAQLVVVALPLDVQVSAEEWKKYGKPPQDLRVTEALGAYVVQTAENIGAKGLDALPVLRAAEPGAFLNADLHMSAKGHAALAEAIAKKLNEPPKAKELALPAGRSWPPTPDEWSAVAEATVKGSTAAHCETKQVREWFRVRCLGDDPDERPAPSRPGPAPYIHLSRGGAGDAYAYVRTNESVLVTPTTGPVEAGFFWTDHMRTLTLDGDARAFSERQPMARPKLPIVPARIMSSGTLDSACITAKQPLPSCAMDNPTRTMTCPEHTVEYGALRRCLPTCAADRTCADSARCIDWQGAPTCVSP